MKENLVEVICIVDRSGSMAMIQTDTVGSFNSFIEQQKKSTKDVRVTVVLFNSTMETLYSGAPVEDVKPMTVESFNPHGTTALLDSIGSTFDLVGSRLSNTEEKNRPSKVIVAIITDGHENASQEYTRDQIVSKIRVQESVYNWTVNLFGLGIDAIKEAPKIGVQVGNTMNLSYSGKSMYDTYTVLSRQIDKD